MLTSAEFSSFDPGIDPYADVEAQIVLDAVPLKDESLPIKLSVLTSTYHRYSQLERSLECLCRQNWKEFEVLICDDGDDRNLQTMFDKFSPYLRLKTIRRSRDYFHVDPTGGFRALFPLAEGEIIALIQPEIMLHPDACWSLYDGHFHTIPDECRYWIGGSENPNSETWVALKIYFMSPTMQESIDTVDWHFDLEMLHVLPDFFTAGNGLSNQSNVFWHSAKEFPWWFVGSARREAGIFRDMPEFLGHASIDFYLLDYRSNFDYVDIVPFRPLGYHQDHHRISFGIEGEQEEIGRAVRRAHERLEENR